MAAGPQAVPRRSAAASPCAIGRRGLLGGFGGLLAAGNGPLGAVWAVEAEAAEPGGPGLRERAARGNLLFGAAARWHELRADHPYAAAFARECAVLVPEWELKWGPLRPGPEVFAFDAADAMRDFARRHRMAFRGHTLVWHEHMPPWASALDRAAAPRALARHIRHAASRYAGGLHSWDVVNEAVEVGDGRPDGLRETVWLRTMGPSYIHEAFALAREADPGAALFYNDYGLDYDDRASRAKRRAVLRLLEALRRDGAPVDALGVQGHIGAVWRFDAPSFARFLRDAADLGLAIYITEFDVTDRDLPADIRARDRAVADAARRYLETALAEPALRGVITWGLSDRYTWMSDFPAFRRRDGLPVRGMPLDAEMRRKPLWSAIAAALDGAAPRPAPA